MSTSANVGVSRVWGMPLAARCHSIPAWQRRTKAALSLLAPAAEMLYEVRQTHFRGNIGEALLKLYLAQASAERQES